MYTIKHSIYSIILLSISFVTAAQTQNCDTQGLNARIIEMRDKEQDIRKKLMEILPDFQKDGSRKMELFQTAMKQKEIDTENINLLKSIFASCGWPDKLSQEAHNGVYLILQHAEYENMIKYAPMVEEKWEAGLIGKDDWPTMRNRILMREGKKQLYGTQTFADKDNNNWVWPVENIDNLDEKRAEVGLPPMEQYFALAKDSMNIIMKWDKTLTIEKALEIKADN